jgi:5-deoxy-glucuronate isomerase
MPEQSDNRRAQTVIQSVVSVGKDTDIISLDVAELAAGESADLVRDDQEMLFMVLTGTVDVTVDDKPLGQAGGRSSVFEGPGYAVYVPPGAHAVLTAVDGPAELAISGAPLADDPAAAARIIPPDDQRIADVGSDNWARNVRTVLGPEHPAGRLLLGETINPPGNWSSYPPHKHDDHRPPTEVKLEEVYLFKVDPADGFGVQIRYADGNEELFTVRNGDVAAIKAGYHPVVAAPGYSLYYLWVMAGEGRQMIPYLDPKHAWVQEGR